jgi:hypothetical protein
MMLINEIEIENLNLYQAQNLVKCINLLCGQVSSEDDLALVKKWINKAKVTVLRFEQFNELLLMLNHPRISQGFYQFFFLNSKKGKKSLHIIKEGVKKFRAYAMLCHGNFRHAYKKWIEMSFDEISADTERQCCLLEDISAAISSRSPKILDVELIPKENLPYLGYISEKEISQDIKNTQAIFYRTNRSGFSWKQYGQKYLENIRKIADDYSQSQINKWRPRITTIIQELDNRQKEIDKTHAIGRKNLDIYLTWDYMDVYIATSMREKWEYEEAFDFVKSVFHDPGIKKYNLRFFDPTQSWVKDRIQKGLVEGLMLKRAKFTIYLVQETDTLGKDSELAITLAQGKPVIAYIPEIHIPEHAKKIGDFPLKFFRNIISILETGDIFLECKGEIENKIGIGTYDKIKEFREILGKYFYERTFNTNLMEENEFKSNNKNIFAIICSAISIAERSYFNKRADTLRNIHPLGLQISLHTGVANGVLVARTVKQCIELIKRIIGNNMKFTLSKDSDGYYLTEEITHSHYRVVTTNEKLTNSFWNFYLD